MFDPGLGRSPRGGPGNPLQYSCLDSPTDRGALQATGQGVAKSRTRLLANKHKPCRVLYTFIENLDFQLKSAGYLLKSFKR